jgi:predicted RNA-binding protein with PUA-like domain
MPDSFPQNVDNTQVILIYQNEAARTCSSLTSPVSSNPHILFRFLSASVYIAADSKASMAIPTVQRHYWIFSADPHHYHWDTLFVKGKEMWHGAGSKPDAIRALKQVRKGDRVLCYHAAPERTLYSIAEVTRDPYPDPHDYKGKNLVADLRAFEKLPRQVSLAEMRANPALKKMKLLKNVRLIVSLLTDLEYQEILRMAGIVATPGIPLP